MSMDSGPQILILGANIEALQAALTLAAMGRRVVLATGSDEILPAGDRIGPEEERERRILALQARYHPFIEIRTRTRLREGKAGAELVREGLWVLPETCTDCEKCVQVCPVDLEGGGHPLYTLDGPTSVAIDKRRPAPCREACPLGMNAQGYIALIAAGRYDEAFDLIQETNPLAGICGRVCDHPCETVCRRAELDQAVAIRDLKRFALERSRIEKAASNGHPRRPKPTGPKVAVIGSGPAGLTAAHDLARAGFRPTIFEADDKPGGLLCQGIAPYRLPAEILDPEIRDILNLGVELRLNARINTGADVEELKDEGFEAVLLCLGAGQDRILGIPGEELTGVMGCVDFLSARWRGESPPELGRVAIIGGGNAAIEAARTALRFGAESVTVVYRRTEKEMPADPHEIEQALEEGVFIKELAGPLAFEGAGDQLEAVQVQRMKLGKRDASGRRSPVPIKGAVEMIQADTAIISVGQGVDLSCVLTEDLPFGERGTVALDQAGTCLPGVYAAGDLVEGPSSVVRAMASGRLAARRIIRELGTGSETLPPEPVLGRDGEDFEPLPQGMEAEFRSSCAVRDPGKRILDCDEVVGTFTETEARAEAARCLQCGVCCECLRCQEACGLGVIDHGREQESLRADFERIILADPGEAMPEMDPAGAVRVPVFGRKNSFAKAVLAGRSTALEALQGLEQETGEALPRPESSGVSTDQGVGTGLLLCSCNGTLNPQGEMDRLAETLAESEGFAAAEVLVSACHPEEGLRVEEFIKEHALGGLVLGSCTCCHLDFVCETCTDQRMRLKGRLFRKSRLPAENIALINLKETCFSPLGAKAGPDTDLAQSLVRTGLAQLTQGRDQGPELALTKSVVVIGANPAGLAAARGLAGSGYRVTVVQRGKVGPDLAKEIRESGAGLVEMDKIKGLSGRRGYFGLQLETSGGVEEFSAGMIILAQGRVKDLRYRGPDSGAGAKSAGSLETSIPGVYLASWPQAKSVSEEALGLAAAGLAMEKGGGGGDYLQTSARTDPELCRGCGECVAVCPEGASRLLEPEPGRSVSVIQPDFCDGCGLCLAVCPTGAISLPEAGAQYYEEVMDALLG